MNRYGDSIWNRVRQQPEGTPHPAQERPGAETLAARQCGSEHGEVQRDAADAEAGTGVEQASDQPTSSVRVSYT